MTLHFYDTLSRKKRAFKPITSGVVTLYTCGPTVYGPPHIGNYRTFLFEDLLRRWLEYRGLKVTQVMNLTDVDDKTINGSRKAGLSLAEFTDNYSQLFFSDLKSLNVQPAEFYPLATKHVAEMVALVQALLERGCAYKSADGSTYFSVAKFKDYGKLAAIDSSQLKAGARVSHDEYTKENLADFVLWKAWDQQDGEVFWQTEIGKGRPGWHLECSAMAMKYLGPTMDIHAGGVDLVFPHHQNEIAQSEAATGKKFVNYWMHAEHLRVNGEKMSKSLGNVYNLPDVMSKGFSPRAVRMLLLSAHYRQPLNFTFEGLQAMEKALQRLSDLCLKLGQAKGKAKAVAPQFAKAALSVFEKALDDDLNCPQAYASLFSLEKEASKQLEAGRLTPEEAAGVLDTLEKMDSVFGFIPLGGIQAPQASKELADWIELKLAQRLAARKARDFTLSDKIRLELAQKGVEVQDTAQGQTWKLANRP
jgi:cysteinyl-tRNA synthetase